MKGNDIQHVYNYCYEDRFTEEDIADRRLYINTEIDSDVTDHIVYHIMRYNRMDKDLRTSERRPIVIYINSPGGSVVDGYGIIDAILTSQTPVYTVNVALCASMAFLVFLAGERRYSMPHSEFLMHDGSTFSYGSASKVQDRMKFESEQIERMTKEYVISHTNISDELYDGKLRVEWYFLPKEGQEIGAVDYIIGANCSLDEIL